jgi:hypothetical protein
MVKKHLLTSLAKNPERKMPMETFREKLSGASTTKLFMAVIYRLL